MGLKLLPVIVCVHLPLSLFVTLVVVIPVGVVVVVCRNGRR